MYEKGKLRREATWGRECCLIELNHALEEDTRTCRRERERLTESSLETPEKVLMHTMSNCSRTKAKAS